MKLSTLCYETLEKVNGNEEKAYNVVYSIFKNIVSTWVSPESISVTTTSM